MPTDRYLDAVRYAAEAHRGQTRKGTPVPYLAHLLGVSSIVFDVGGTEDEAIAGLLHDAVEDQGGRARLEEIRTQFGDRVAAIVEGLLRLGDGAQAALARPQAGVSQSSSRGAG
jgi:(p)ppGpp synthase/HD superfamily hydrolase